jgi:hypothetical protein
METGRNTKVDLALAEKQRKGPVLHGIFRFLGELSTQQMQFFVHVSDPHRRRFNGEIHSQGSLNVHIKAGGRRPVRSEKMFYETDELVNDQSAAGVFFYLHDLDQSLDLCLITGTMSKNE